MGGDNDFSKPPDKPIPISMLYNQYKNLSKNLLPNVDFVAVPYHMWRLLKLWYGADEKIQ